MLQERRRKTRHQPVRRSGRLNGSAAEFGPIDEDACGGCTYEDYEPGLKDLLAGERAAVAVKRDVTVSGALGACRDAHADLQQLQKSFLLIFIHTLTLLCLLVCPGDAEIEALPEEKQVQFQEMRCAAAGRGSMYDSVAGGFVHQAAAASVWVMPGQVDRSCLPCCAVLRLQLITCKLNAAHKQQL